MWVSQGGLPIGLPIGGYHHGTTEKAGNRHRARRREIVALGVRRDARRRGAREQARSQQGKRPRLAFRRVPRSPRRRRPGPQHRRARALPRAGGGNAVGVPAGPGRPRGRQAVRRRRQDRRARRDGHREDRARHPGRAAAGPPIPTPRSRRRGRSRRKGIS